MKVRFLDGDIGDFSSKLIIEESSIGNVSEDRSAVIGKENWCFIYQGSNDYRGGYLKKDLNEVGVQWGALIERRYRACECLGIKFLQIIVPNKLTIHPESFPENLDSNITFILRNFLKSDIAGRSLVPLDLFREECVRNAVFRRNDSHLAVGGNAILAASILAKLDLSHYSFGNVVTSRIRHHGDLGGKFLPPLDEDVSAPSFSDGLLDQGKIEKIYENIQTSLTGTHQVFKNSSAPIKAKLVVFGNSFFERVPSWGLSPFFSAIFEEYHFIWAPDIDFEYVETVKPDYVIAQTCERFMSKLPSDNYPE